MNKYIPNNPMRQRIVFFEGLDKSGKSLLCRKARFASGHEVLMFDRGFVGRRVFRKFRQEFEYPIEDLNSLESLLMSTDSYAVIYLKIPAKVSLNRQLAVGEKPEFTLEDLEYQGKLYDEDIELLQTSGGVPVLVIDTSSETENQSLEKVVQWIKGDFTWKLEKTSNTTPN